MSWGRNGSAHRLRVVLYSMALYGCVTSWLCVFTCLRGEIKFQNELVIVAPAVAFWRSFSSLKLSLKSLSCLHLRNMSVCMMMVAHAYVCSPSWQTLGYARDHILSASVCRIKNKSYVDSICIGWFNVHVRVIVWRLLHSYHFHRFAHDRING